MSARSKFLIGNALLAFAIVLMSGAAAQISTDGSAGQGQLGGAYNNGVTGYQSGQAPVGNPGEAGQGVTYSTGGQTLNSALGALGPNLAPIAPTGTAPGSPGPTYGLNGTGYSPGTLPPTTLDSFVYNSGYDDTIYGDEGSYGPPPYWDFDTIGSGIYAGGLSTGHASALPSSWGYTSGTY